MNLNYGVSVTSTTINDLPWYIENWHINFADLVSVGGCSSNYASELAYIKGLGLQARLDIEMDIWNAGNILGPISDFAAYFESLKQAGWSLVCSEGGREGDPSFVAKYGLGYINYNCDQCGLHKNLYLDPGTIKNLWECYFPSEVPSIQQGAEKSGKLNGILAGAWVDSPTAPNKILSNSLNGTAPSYKSVIANLLAAGKPVVDFEVWGGVFSNKGQNQACGFDRIIADLQSTYPPNKIGRA
jgi:hypothetical protein